MEMIFEIHKKRVISYLPALESYPDIVAFKDEQYIDETIVKSEQGFAYLSDIQKQTKTSVIKEVTKKISKNVVRLAVFEGNEMRNRLRLHSMNGADFKASRGIDDVYDLVEKHGILDEAGKDFDVMWFYYENYYSLNKEMVAQAVYFSYLDNLTNALFNLEKMLKLIRHRKDIAWLNENKKPEISAIPFYNAGEGRDSHLYFKWVPSDEDFQKLEKSDSGRPHKQSVLTEVFGINLEEIAIKGSSEF